MRARRRPPGAQHFFTERSSGSGRLNPNPPVYHDGAVSPSGTGPFKRSKRARRLPTNTAPTPGSVSGSRVQVN